MVLSFGISLTRYTKPPKKSLLGVLPLKLLEMYTSINYCNSTRNTFKLRLK